MKRSHLIMIIVIAFVLLIFSVAFVFLSTTIGYLPIFGQLIARSKIEKYTGTAVDSAVYNFKNSSYTVTSGGTEYRYSIQENAIFDPAISYQQNDQIKIKYDELGDHIKEVGN